MSATEPQHLHLSAYGKLPLSREFLQFGCQGAGAKRFCDLLHEAAPHVAELPPGERAFRVYMPVGDSRELIVASVWPSSDERGLRRFPFSCFVEMERPAAPLGFFASLEPVHADLTRAYEAVSGLPDASAFEQALRAQPWVSPPRPTEEAWADHRAEAAKRATADWTKALFGADPGSACLAFWRLHKLAAAAGESLSALRRRIGLRVPLAANNDLTLQADAWLGLITRGGALECPFDIILGPLDGGGTASLTLFFRSLRPGDFAIAADHPVDGLIDLAQPKKLADMDGFEEFCGRVDGFLAAHRALDSLPHFLDETGGVA